MKRFVGWILWPLVAFTALAMLRDILLTPVAVAQDKKISQLTAGAPAVATDTFPIARSGANFSLTVGDVWTLGGTLGSGKQVLGPAANNCTAPPFSFASQTTSGFCSSASGTLNLRVAGTNYFAMTSTALTLTVPIVVPNGLVSATAIAPSAGLSTGLYFDGSNGITSIAAAGTPIATFRNSAPNLRINQSIGFGTDGLTADVILRRGGAAATLQLGSDVNGAAVAQTIKAHDGITGTNIAGANLTIAGGRGTGAGASGVVAFSTALELGSGTTAQTLAERLRIQGPSTQGASSKALTESSATVFVQVAIPQTAAANYAAGEVIYTVYETDGTDSAVIEGKFKFSCANKSGTEGCAAIADVQTAAYATGVNTLACTITAVTGLTDAVQFAANCTDAATLTQSTLQIQYRLDMPQINTVTPQ